MVLQCAWPQAYALDGVTWKINACELMVNSLWPSDVIWRHRTGSKLAQVTACCLTTLNFSFILDYSEGRPNLALGRPTFAVGTPISSPFGQARLAVDGCGYPGTDNAYCCLHSALVDSGGQRNLWWVDLGKEYVISHVIIVPTNTGDRSQLR